MTTRATLSIAEQLLSQVFGGILRLTLAPAPEGGSQRSKLLRCRVLDGPSAAPASVIIKRVNTGEGQRFNSDAIDPSTRAFFNEWASLAFLTRLADEGAPLIGPRLYSADRAAGVLVMEDLGQGESLVQPLLGADRVVAEAAIDAYFRSLGRLGAQTHARTDEYWEIRNALGPPDPYTQPTLESEHNMLQRWLAMICEACGVTPVPGTEVDLAEAARFNAMPGPFAALSQSDTCPDNCLREGEWMRLLDFEWGWVRNALNDGGRARSNFPTCWCVHRLPRETIRRAEAVYRAEVAKGCPAAADDSLFKRELVKACASWALATFEFYEEVSDMWQNDGMWGTSTTRQRAITRLGLLAEASAEFGMLEALGETAAVLAGRLKQLWPDVEPMSLYPAFDECASV